MNFRNTAVLTALVICSIAAQAQAQVGSDIEALLTRSPLVIRGEEILAEEIIRNVYRDNDFRPYWTDQKNINELMVLIEQAPDHGLNPADYNIGQLHQILADRVARPSVEIKAESDIMLTESLIRYGYHRRLGKVKASSLDPDVNFRREAFRNQPPAQTLHEILAASSLQGYIDLAAPAGPYYQDMQSWLKEYREIDARGGWPTVSEGPTLRVGDSSPRVAMIRARLAVTGDLDEAAKNQSTVFDEPLKQSVMVFQKRHALEADGIVGKQSVTEMNVPVKNRIDQLRVSLERLRWVNQEAADTLVVVNIAGYRAFFYKDGEMAWSTRAMVGKTYRRTPVFRGDIQYMEFNPTWTIPPGIIRNDTLPAIKRDPNYLASKNIRVLDSSGKAIDPATVNWNQYSKGVPYTLRQDPGPDNSLGTVKFIFPNSHFVFLHDTPHRELFDRADRAFSSGCIRIEDPLVLAELLLDDEQYRQARLQAIVDSRDTQRIVLAKTVPVLIMYLTTGIDINGNILFYRDIYEKDQKVLDALNGRVVLELPPSENQRDRLIPEA